MVRNRGDVLDRHFTFFLQRAHCRDRMASPSRPRTLDEHVDLAMPCSHGTAAPRPCAICAANGVDFP